jgi:hypothetical protein
MSREFRGGATKRILKAASWIDSVKRAVQSRRAFTVLLQYYCFFCGILNSNQFIMQALMQNRGHFNGRE